MAEDIKEDKTPDAGQQIVEKAFGNSNPDILKVLLAVQGTEEQRKAFSDLLQKSQPVVAVIPR